MQKIEGQMETTVEVEQARRQYARPTVETLDVGMTRNKTTASPESIDPVLGS